MAHKNKIQGSIWNLETVNFFARIFGLTPFNNKNHSEFNISSSQATSKPLDGQGVDVYFSPSLPSWITSIYVQCKKTLIQTKTTYTIDIKALLDMKVNKGINLLFTKVTKRELTKKGVQSKKETVVTELVTMELSTFEVFLEAYRNQNCVEDALKSLRQYNPLKPEENGFYLP